MNNTYILRDSQIKLEKILDSQKIDRDIIVVEGVKKVGKTTLVKEVFNERPHVWIDFETDKSLVREIDLSADFNEFQDILALRYGFVPGKDRALVIDTAHLSEKLTQYLLESREVWQNQTVVLITSLTSRLFSQGIKEVNDSIKRVLVCPYSFLDFVKATKEDYLHDQLLEWNIAKPFNDTLHQKALSVLEAYLNVGGLPSVVAAYHKGNDWHDMLNEFIFDYVDEYKKIRGEKNAGLFETCLQRVSQTLGEPSKTTTVLPSNHKDYPNIPKMMRFIESLSIIYNTPLKTPQTKNSKRLPPKRYVFDHGIRNHFSTTTNELMSSLTSSTRTPTGFVQGLFENHVLCELKSRGIREAISWRQKFNGSEVSFVIRSGQQLIPIDVKPSLKTNKKFFTSLLTCLDSLKLKRGVLFNADKGAIHKIGDKTILQVPIYSVFKL